MKKVVIINTVYEYGSTGLLAEQLYEYGEGHGYEAFVFYGRGKRIDSPKIIKIDSTLECVLHKVLTLLTGYQGYFSNAATNKLLSFIESEGIDRVILLNLHGYYLNEKKLLNYLKENKIVTAYITPDEYAGMGKCCYSKECEKYKTGCEKCPYVRDYPKSLFFDRSKEIFELKKELYNGFDTVTFVGPESNLVKFRESVLLKDKPLKAASWGIDLECYKYKIDDSLYKKYVIPKDKILILTVASYSDSRKGVKKYFFEIARRCIGSDYHFINVGYDGNLSSEEMPENMTVIGYMDDQKELACIYSMSDLYVLASTTDTQPMSCLISFACSTPVCCFYASGLRYLADRDSMAIRYCDTISVDAMESIVKSTEKKNRKIMEACRELAADEYSLDAFNRKVYEVIDREK